MNVSAEGVEAVAEVVPWEEVSESFEQKRIDYLAAKKKSLRARYIYGVVFLFTNLCAWFIRDYGQRVLPQLHYFKSCGIRGSDCFRTLGVLRVSLGSCIFFFLMFLTASKTRKLSEARNVWHSGWWGFKFCILFVSMVVPLFIPPHFIQLYGEFARVGAGIFLVLQLISVIQFITWWNKYWMPDEQKEAQMNLVTVFLAPLVQAHVPAQFSVTYPSISMTSFSAAQNIHILICSLGLFMSTLFYIASMGGIAFMYSSYGMKLSCPLNIFFITWTVILLVVMMVISLHSKVNRGLLSSGIMASYLVFLCWSAIRSEPANEECNNQKQGNGHDWTTVLGFLIAICSIVMATFSTGIDSQSFQFYKDQVREDDDIPYKYGFFHLTFSLGCMYFAMLFISWNLGNSAKKWSIDVGWTSTWVKIVNEWFAASVFLWTLISPAVRQSKVMVREEAVQEIDNSDVP